jgi:hypothetical protein
VRCSRNSRFPPESSSAACEFELVSRLTPFGEGLEARTAPLYQPLRRHVLRRPGRGIQEPSVRPPPRRPTGAPGLAGPRLQRGARRDPPGSGRAVAPSMAGADPFSLGDPRTAEGILAAARFTDVVFDDVHEPVFHGPDVATAYDFVLGLRGTRELLTALDLPRGGGPATGCAPSLPPTRRRAASSSTPAPGSSPPGGGRDVGPTRPRRSGRHEASRPRWNTAAWRRCAPLARTRCRVFAMTA